MFHYKEINKASWERFLKRVTILSVSKIWENGQFHPFIDGGNINFYRDFGGQFDNMH